jgi:type II pantothenate kinase
MPHLPLLADPARYSAHTIDMVGDPAARDYWLTVFESQLDRNERRAAQSAGDTPDARRRAAEFRAMWGRRLESIRRDPPGDESLSILLLCHLRQDCWDACGFADPFLDIKRRENDAALAHLPALLAELDALADPALRWLTAIQGVFAGNIFDLGCEKTTALYESGSIGFHDTRATHTRRPWLVDDFDALGRRLERAPHRKAVVFVDNAGSDVVLGMLPLIRLLLQRGTEVVAASNSHPALNDITHGELVELVDRVAAFDTVIAAARRDGRLRLVGSGNRVPVIDLARISPELAEAASGADLLVLEGMGRALETNYHARFGCDALKLAMVKEQDVARLLGGKLYDVVCRFEPASPGAAGDGPKDGS